MISHKLHEDQQIVEIQYTGNVYVQDIVDFINVLAAKSDLPKQLRAVTFATEANFMFSHSELSPIVEAMARLSKKIDSLNEAFIIDSPQSVVLATTFKIMNSKTVNYHIEIFSTEEAAFRWQGIDHLDKSQK